MQVMVKPRSASAVLVISITDTASSFIELYLRVASRTVMLPAVEMRAEQRFQLARSHFSGDVIGVGSMLQACNSPEL